MDLVDPHLYEVAGSLLLAAKRQVHFDPTDTGAWLALALGVWGVRASWGFLDGSPLPHGYYAVQCTAHADHTYHHNIINGWRQFRVCGVCAAPAAYVRVKDVLDENDRAIGESDLLDATIRGKSP